MQVPKDVYKKHVRYERGHSNTRRRFHGTSCSSECTYFVDLEVGNYYRIYHARINISFVGRCSPSNTKAVHSTLAR